MKFWFESIQFDFKLSAGLHYLVSLHRPNSSYCSIIVLGHMVTCTHSHLSMNLSTIYNTYQFQFRYHILFTPVRPPTFTLRFTTYKYALISKSINYRMEAFESTQIYVCIDRLTQNSNRINCDFEHIFVMHRIVMPSTHNIYINGTFQLKNH